MWDLWWCLYWCIALSLIFILFTQRIHLCLQLLLPGFAPYLSYNFFSLLWNKKENSLIGVWKKNAIAFSWTGVQIHGYAWTHLSRPTLVIMSIFWDCWSLYNFLNATKWVYKDVSYIHHSTLLLTKSEDRIIISISLSGLYCLSTRHGLIIANKCCRDDSSLPFSSPPTCI